MHPSQTRDIWEISNNYDLLIKRHSPYSSYSNYLRTCKPEIVEIIDQLTSKNKLAGYKINDLSPLRKLHYAVGRNIKELFCIIKRWNSSNLPSIDSELLIFVEYENHYRQYESLYEYSSLANLRHTVLYLNAEVYERHKGVVENSILINSLYSKGDFVRSFCKMWFINAIIVFDTILNRLTNNRGWRLKVELIYMNSKFLIQKYLLEKSVQGLVKENLKTAVFFKAEGFKIRSLIELYKRAGIKTIAIQHGLIIKNIKYNDLLVDTYLVWSEHFAKELDMSNAKCITQSVGCAIYDQHFHKKPANDVKINSKKLHFLFLPNSGQSQTPETEVVFALSICLKYASKNPNSKLTIKPHPGGNSELIRDFIMECELTSVVLQDKYEKINYDQHDIIVTMNSTVGIESAIYRRPIIVIASSSEILIVDDYFNYGIGEFVNSYDNMLIAIDKITSNYKEYQNRCDTFVGDYLTKPGTAAIAIVDHISNCLLISD